MKSVIIQRREEHEGRPEDVQFYAALHATMLKEATELREAGVLSDHDIIAITTRTLQQLAANATDLAEQMGVVLD